MNRFRSPLALASATQYLILASIAVYAIQILQQPKGSPGFFGLFDITRITWFEVTFGLITPPQVPEVFWQLVTYMFLHGGLWHILFNMWALWLFGNALERVWGIQRFFVYYFFTGIGAGLTVVMIALLTDPSALRVSITIGASGAIYGLLLAFGMLFPNQPLYLFFIPVAIPAKYAVLLLGAFAFVASLTNIMPGISNIGHLGGLLFGLIYVKGRAWWRRLQGAGR